MGKKLRDLTDEMYLVTNFMRIFSIAKRINKKITIQKADDPNKNSTDQASFLTESYSFDLPFFWKFTYIPRYVKYFNSFEAKPLPIIESTKYQYADTPTLYKETHFKVWVKNGIVSILDKWGNKLIQDKKRYIITEDMYKYICTYSPDGLR